jgi:hypothetical protein
MQGNLEALARDWLDARRAEAAAAQRRHTIEAQLAAALDVPAEGSRTHRLNGYKVTLTQPVTRRVDEAAWEQVRNRCPPDLQPVKIRIEADAAGCKYLANNEPEIWRAIARAFETKPGKIGVRVEEV